MIFSQCKCRLALKWVMACLLSTWSLLLYSRLRVVSDSTVRRFKPKCRGGENQAMEDCRRIAEEGVERMAAVREREGGAEVGPKVGVGKMMRAAKMNVQNRA